MRAGSRVSTFLTLLLFAPVPVAAQNLLTNPDFDTDLSGWTSEVFWINGSFDAEDMAEPSASGSARVENSRSTGGGNGLFQCVLADEGDFHDFSIWTRIPTGQAMTGEAALRLWWFGNTTCDFADPLDFQTSEITTPSASWTEIAMLGVEAPAGTQSVRFDLGVSKDAAGGTFEAKFDAVYMPEPQPALGMLAGSLALLGLHAAGGRARPRERRD